jgi:hypothetical protein
MDYNINENKLVFMKIDKTGMVSVYQKSVSTVLIF